jgi:hypothetical protein
LNALLLDHTVLHDSGAIRADLTDQLHEAQAVLTSTTPATQTVAA